FKFLNYAKLNSPDIQPYIYQRWPRLPAGVEATTQSWDSLWSRAYDPGTSERYDSRDFFEKLTDTIRSRQTDTKKCLVIPVGEVMHNLNEKMREGKMPNYQNIWQVYYDDIHMKGIGSYIIAVTFYATLYKTDPRGISAPGFYGWFTPEQKALIQQAVYEVVLGYKDHHDKPWSGVNEITNVSTINKIENQFQIIQSSSGLNVTFNPSGDQSVKRIQLFSINGQLLQSLLATQYCVLYPQHKGIYLLRIEDLAGKTIFPSQKVFFK
ncbi:MAG TPA: hypothetical protein VJ951_03810, partial [Bacteroidales bacterium]|nr:hypothetical protein [Bacteroidales bacterium]